MSCRVGRARPGSQEVGPPSRIERFETARNWVARPDNSGGGPTMSNPTRWVGIDLHRRRSQIAREGILPEHTDLFGKAGREFLADLQLPDGPSRRLRSMLSLL